MKLKIASIYFLIGISFGFTESKDFHKVHCTENEMLVDIVLENDDNTPNIYLEGLKGYPNEKCQPNINETLAQFRLSLTDIYECGVTRMVNKITGKKVYYHKIIIESGTGKELVSVKCITTGPVYNVMNQTTIGNNQMVHHGIVRRDVLPAGFQEPEDLEITTSLTEHAPEPILGVDVRQNGEVVTGDLNVSPGTPLSMEIYLDKGSAPVYGLAVTYMQVTDTRAQEETIIFNGCSVDPYLFENFNTIDGDSLSAKFRAFKFPESTYVQFRATVNVCLDKCLGTPCSNGQIGYGRRKREISNTNDSSGTDPNKIYEISLATFIKVNDVDGVLNKNLKLELEEKIRQLRIANQKLARNSRGSISMSGMESMEQVTGSSAATVYDEETLLKISEQSIPRSGSETRLPMIPLISFLVIIFKIFL
ncbi:uncharacterized protein LOC129610930 [Condylostylus longicornis]|uniref:uncharacterized protein LOC129610930 n=1 Tax=Condylostylus longicornis TaxID=2530218 RepID=UPI00244E2EDD|nr:uncharacterized protein LOC129610930 [Condylostylus longicornis]